MMIWSSIFRENSGNIIRNTSRDMFVIFLEDGLCLTVTNKVLIVCLPLEVICNYG